MSWKRLRKNLSGLSVPELLSRVNLSKGRVDKTIVLFTSKHRLLSLSRAANGSSQRQN